MQRPAAGWVRRRRAPAPMAPWPPGQHHTLRTGQGKELRPQSQQCTVCSAASKNMYCALCPPSCCGPALTDCLHKPPRPIFKQWLLAAHCCARTMLVCARGVVVHAQLLQSHQRRQGRNTVQCEGVEAEVKAGQGGRSVQTTQAGYAVLLHVGKHISKRVLIKCCASSKRTDPRLNPCLACASGTATVGNLLL